MGHKKTASRTMSLVRAIDNDSELSDAQKKEFLETVISSLQNISACEKSKKFSDRLDTFINTYYGEKYFEKTFGTLEEWFALKRYISGKEGTTESVLTLFKQEHVDSQNNDNNDDMLSTNSQPKSRFAK